MWCVARVMFTAVMIIPKLISSFLGGFILVSATHAADPTPLIPGTSTRSKEAASTDKFLPSYDSLAQYEFPEWFRDAKFGIWAHWGPQSVPELGDWYGRFLYNPQDNQNEWRKKGGEKAYTHHIKTYGHPSVFGYKDLIPLFKAERWNPKELMNLYYKAGARYFMSMGQHHDNFDMWNSKHQPWNAVNMGPKRDIVREWQSAAKELNMRFGVSFHGSSSWSWFEASRGADQEGPLKGVPYDGNMTKADGIGKWWEGYDPHDLYCTPHEPGAPKSQAYIDKFSARLDDLVENYKPDLIYFDGGLPHNRLDVVSNFYNSSIRWHGKNEAVVNVKGITGEKRKMFVFDIENGQAEDLEPYPWQTDTSFDGWFVSKASTPTATKKIVQQLVDIVSKNGNLMLNITQSSDGTIKDYSLRFLAQMASWMDINAEAIHGTRPWVIYGEGPTKITDGESKKAKRPNYTPQDIRFTTKGNDLYAMIMEWPEDDVVIRTLTPDRKLWFGEIREIKLLGETSPLKWRQGADGITVSLPKTKVGDYVYVLKISGG